MERRDEWDVARDANRRELARTQVRLAALEQYHERLATAYSGRPQPVVTEIALDDERLARLDALADELTEARVAREAAVLRRKAIAAFHGVDEERESATAELEN